MARGEVSVFVWLLLTAFAPSPRFAIPGDPAPLLQARAEVQWRLSSRADWRALQARWGGRWSMRWDERDATPRFVTVPGVAVADGPDLAAALASLAGVAPGDLVALPPVKAGHQVHLRWARTARGAPVLGDGVRLVATDGRIGAAFVQLTRIGALPAPLPGEMVLPLPLVGDAVDAPGPSTRVRPLLVTEGREGAVRVWSDRAGRVWLRRDTRHPGVLSVEAYDRTVGDARVASPLRGFPLLDGAGARHVTADDGSHPAEGPVRIQLEGAAVRVRQRGAVVDVSADADATLTGGAAVADSVAVLAVHGHRVRDWLAQRWPSHSWLAGQIQADVDLDGACNAWYTGGTVNFLRAGSGCRNFGEIADVVYHEVGHGIHHYIITGGTFAGDVSEGSADYVSATLTGDPVLAPNAFDSGGYIRELDTDRRYPDDYVGQVHNDGLIWASFLWNLRSEWEAADGEAGVERADTLFLGALSLGPTLTDLHDAVIAADDDDGDLSNGTPNDCLLLDRLAHHGLGPGPIGVLDVAHTPLGDQPSAARSYPVQFTLRQASSGCGGLDESSVRLWATVVPSPALPGDTAAPDTGDTGAPAAIWTEIPIVAVDGVWTGEIPRQLAGATVSYFFAAASDDGTQVIASHGGRADGLFSFTVGDREALWCSDFEGGPGGWEHGGGTPADPLAGPGRSEWGFGAPSGAGGFDPPAPAAGGAIAGINLEGNYSPNNQQVLRSPRFTLPAPAPLQALRFWRFLTVEDGIYDQARVVRPDGTVLWENRASPGGADHTLDTDWVRISIDTAALGAPGEEASVVFTLQTDPGLEFGGWHLDDVCLEQLADVPGHYRRVGLVASDDASDVVSITWENPWIAPLAEVVLVRSEAGLPATPEDGEVLWSDGAPVPGAAGSLVDPGLPPGGRAFYVLFARAGADEPWSAAELGANADEGGVVAPGVDTADGGDSGGADGAGPDGVAPEEQRKRTCGCAAGSRAGAPAVGVVLALAAGVVGRRRRR